MAAVREIANIGNTLMFYNAVVVLFKLTRSYNPHSGFMFWYYLREFEYPVLIGQFSLTLVFAAIQLGGYPNGQL
jgi:hypothetical protein